MQRQLWRGQAVYIRSLFDANKDLRDRRQQQVMLHQKLPPTQDNPSTYTPRQNLSRKHSRHQSGCRPITPVQLIPSLTLPCSAHRSSSPKQKTCSRNGSTQTRTGRQRPLVVRSTRGIYLRRIYHVCSLSYTQLSFPFSRSFWDPLLERFADSPWLCNSAAEGDGQAVMISHQLIFDQPID